MQARYRRSIHKPLFEGDVSSTNLRTNPPGYLIPNIQQNAVYQISVFGCSYHFLKNYHFPPRTKINSLSSKDLEDTYPFYKVSKFYSKIHNQHNSLYLHSFYWISVFQWKSESEMNFHKYPKYFSKCGKVFHFMKDDPNLLIWTIIQYCRFIRQQN